jgi:hypothetical protein
MKLERNPDTGLPNLTLTCGSDMGFNFETFYLRWRLPRNFRVMDTIDRLGGYAFTSSASNIVVESTGSNLTPVVDVNPGHVVARVSGPGKMYLGLEHSTTARKGGYVLTALADAIRAARDSGARNPTLEIGAVSEGEILAESV